MGKVLISGGTGAIGQHLCERLTEKGFEPFLLSRSASSSKSKYPCYHWDPKKGRLQKGALSDCEYLINLAGAGIADERWSSKRKAILTESRVGTTRFLLEQVKDKNPPLKAYISASATGYYGQVTLKDRIFTEKDQPGDDFVGQLCLQWEKAALDFEKLGLRTVRLRIGIVLMREAGALEKMAAPVRMGLGAPLGSGNQIIPWIHIDDLSRIILEAMNNQHYTGAINCCAPEASDNRSFTKAIGKTLKKAILPVPVPGLLLRLALGERADLVLKGSAVHPEKLIELGYSFQFPSLGPALSDILAD